MAVVVFNERAYSLVNIVSPIDGNGKFFLDLPDCLQVLPLKNYHCWKHTLKGNYSSFPFTVWLLRFLNGRMAYRFRILLHSSPKRNTTFWKNIRQNVFPFKNYNSHRFLTMAISSQTKGGESMSFPIYIARSSLMYLLLSGWQDPKKRLIKEV